MMIKTTMMMMIKMVMFMDMIETLSTAIGSMGRTGGSSSGIPIDIIGRMPFIVLHDDDDDDADDDDDDDDDNND